MTSDTSEVEIESKVYPKVVLTYKFNVGPLILHGFSFKAIEDLKDTADTLVVEYKHNGDRKIKKWKDKIPKVKEE